MITDEDVVQLFQSTIPESSLRDADVAIEHRPRQIFRGITAFQWKGQHTAGCFRHFTVFNKFGVIPKYCFDCCKVLIEPRTVMELFKLLMVFEKLKLPIDNTRKCMCEDRAYCSGTYKGFIYCRGIEEAKLVHKLVSKVVWEDISPEIPVTMKRGCSEFERVYPGYERIKPGKVTMKYKNEWKAKEDFVDANAVFDAPDVNVDGNTDNPLEIFAKHHWLRYAATIGDMSYLAITGTAIPPLPNLKRPPFVSKAPL